MRTQLHNFFTETLFSVKYICNISQPAEIDNCRSPTSIITAKWIAVATATYLILRYSNIHIYRYSYIHIHRYSFSCFYQYIER